MLAYLLALIAFIPAGVVLSESDNLKVGGTIWNGEAVLASTMRIEWTFAPLASLTRLGLIADWRTSGGGTDLAGSVTKRGGTIRLEDVSGQIDGSLLNALAPNLPLACAFVGDVRIDSLQWGGSEQQARGTIRTSAAKCSARVAAVAPVELPAMRAIIEPGARVTRGALASAAARTSFVELRLSRAGALSIWPTAALVQRAPLLAGQRYDTVIE